MEYNYSTPVKDCQQSGNYKVSKTHNQTREGDWICFNCNNLNFSFRKKCNRCKTQTRKQNQDLQNAYTLYYYNHHDGAMYSYQNGTLYQPHETNYTMAVGLNEQEVANGYGNEHQSDNTLTFSRTHPNNNNHVIEITLTSPFKDLLNTNQLIEDKINKKLRTPSSRKKKSHMKKNDLLPSVSPLLKKLLAKEDTNNKSNKENVLQKKDPLNVALFFDEIWNNNKENLLPIESNDQNNSNNICLTNSGKKIMRNSNIQKTNDSLCKERSEEEIQFSYLLKSPQGDEQQEEIIEIDSGDQQLAQIINRIMI